MDTLKDTIEATFERMALAEAVTIELEATAELEDEAVVEALSELAREKAAELLRAFEESVQISAVIEEEGETDSLECTLPESVMQNIAAAMEKSGDLSTFLDVDLQKATEKINLSAQLTEEMKEVFEAIFGAIIGKEDTTTDLSLARELEELAASIAISGQIAEQTEKSIAIMEENCVVSVRLEKSEEAQDTDMCLDESLAQCATASMKKSAEFSAFEDTGIVKSAETLEEIVEIAETTQEAVQATILRTGAEEIGVTEKLEDKKVVEAKTEKVIHVTAKEILSQGMCRITDKAGRAAPMPIG